MFETRQRSNTEIELLHPVNQEVSHYIFSTLTTDFTNLKKLKETSFVRKVEVIYLGQLKSNNIFQLLCTAVDFHGDYLEDASLLRKICYVFDEVVVSVNAAGNIIQVNNHVEILKRWQDTKAVLEKETEGYIVSGFFDTMDRLMCNTEDLIRLLSENKMYGLYFNGYWGKHHNQTPRLKQLDDTRTEQIEVFEYDRKERGVELSINLLNSDELYDGRFLYQDHQLMEASLELNELDHHIKYNVLCLGLRKY